MQPRNAERFPKVTAHEHAFLDAEVRADSQPPRLSIPERECLLDDFQLPPDYDALVAAATAWVSPPARGPGRPGCSLGQRDDQRDPASPRRAGCDPRLPRE